MLECQGDQGHHPGELAFARYRYQHRPPQRSQRVEIPDHPKLLRGVPGIVHRIVDGDPRIDDHLPDTPPPQRLQPGAQPGCDLLRLVVRELQRVDIVRIGALDVGHHCGSGGGR